MWTEIQDFASLKSYSKRQTNSRTKTYHLKPFNRVYNFSCSCCTASHIGKTYKHMKVRVSEHQGVSPRTGKSVKGSLLTSARVQ